MLSKQFEYPKFVYKRVREIKFVKKRKVVIMTSFTTQTIAGPVISSMVTSDKGDFSNRTKCAGAQLKNNLTTGLTSGAVGVAAGTGILYASKNPRRLVKIAQAFDKIAKKILPKNVNLKKLNNRSKVAMAIGLPLMVISSFISGRHLYKMGQIDQKYSDQAKLKEHQNNILA